MEGELKPALMKTGKGKVVGSSGQVPLDRLECVEWENLGAHLYRQ
jgi:hypothetical protein